MKRLLLGFLAALLLLLPGVTALAQENTQYLDIYTVKVKPEKRAEFDALAKRFVEANRKNKGDYWLAMETMYGEGNVVSFISVRPTYGDIDKAFVDFMQAISKAFGPAGTQKLMNDFSACLESSHGELRRRRPDLSSNAPRDAAGMAKFLGSSRFLRTIAVRVRPGHIANFEAMVKEVKAAREKAAPENVVLISQGVAGQEGTTFFVTTLQPSMAGFDRMKTNDQILGAEGYQKFLKMNAEAVETTYTYINRYVSELSNAPPDIVAAAPDFWGPKASVATKKATKPESKSVAKD